MVVMLDPHQSWPASPHYVVLSWGYTEDTDTVSFRYNGPLSTCPSDVSPLPFLTSTYTVMHLHDERVF